MVKQVDSKIEANKALKAFVVMLGDDVPTVQAALEKLAADNKIENVPLTLIPDTVGPDVYQIDKDAEVTVMMWKGSKVIVNHAFAKGELTDDKVKTIVADLPKVLDNKK